MAGLGKGQGGAGADGAVLTLCVPEVRIYGSADVFIREVEIHLERVLLVENLRPQSQVYGVPLSREGLTYVHVQAVLIYLCYKVGLHGCLEGYVCS